MDTKEIQVKYMHQRTLTEYSITLITEHQIWVTILLTLKYQNHLYPIQMLRHSLPLHRENQKDKDIKNEPNENN